jgi:nucleotide-binding universal stress UspA family protein
VRQVVADLPADLAVLKDRGLGELHRLLVPWGGGHHAQLGLELAARIAAATGAGIEVLRIVRDGVDHEREAAAVAEQVARLTGRDDVEVLVRAGEDVPGVIVEVALERRSDLLVIGASGESRLRSVLFGAIPDVVADEAPCSVLLVRRYVPPHWTYRVTERVKRARERAGMTSSPTDHEPRG